MTALDRRLEKIEQALDPTEAVVRWLEEAKSCGNYAAYSESLLGRPLLNPYTAIPSVVAMWAGHVPGSKPDRTVNQRVEGAVRSALVRVSLVERQNHLLTLGAPADCNQLDLLRMLEPLVLTGRVEPYTEAQWVEHAGRLVDEARLWSKGAELLGSRYFAGRSPLFPDVEKYLTELQEACEELLHEYNAAARRTRGRRPKGEPVDLGLIDQHVAQLLEAHTDGLVRQARQETEVLLGERARELSIPRLLGMREGT